ncbi:N-acetylglucosamine kinase [Streptomyces pacificus]|uniref:ATPase n=1 Tax=Streptomyces pacificus TaxID=2705029 RepID=A0A6A0APF7_9ACTN|nr:BadF/BadG/BcrA/BcrD ATPase family protein [Streptomyces pacificus]GFH34722.1 ATPase [Streptomyces pacificus]
MTGGGAGDWVLGVDSGGSGLRVALAPAAAPSSSLSSAPGEPVRTGGSGIEAAHLLQQLLPMARELLRRAGVAVPAAAAVGAAGMASLGDELVAVLPGALSRELGVRQVALAADAVTAYAGALGQRPGAVVAAGTGMIATGTDLASWQRADGWGHLLGDCGSGAWIGRAGLEAALRAHDGRAGGSPALLQRLEDVFGPAASLPGVLYPRTDRPAVLASFAPEVARCADDPVAAGILSAAASHIAQTAAAVCPPPSAGDCRVALTGGLFAMGDPLLVPLRGALARELPHAEPVPAAGDPLSGSLTVAAALADGTLKLPHDPRLLVLTTPLTRQTGTGDR